MSILSMNRPIGIFSLQVVSSVCLSVVPSAAFPAEFILAFFQLAGIKSLVATPEVSSGKHHACKACQSKVGGIEF